MGLLSISDVAAATGLRPSALRYYEEVGLIRSAGRVANRRHYDPSVLERLWLLALCQDVGFTIAELREVFDPESGGRARWREVAGRKLGEIDAHIERARTTKRLLESALACDCGHLEGCEMVADAGERRRELPLHRGRG